MEDAEERQKGKIKDFLNFFIKTYQTVNPQRIGQVDTMLDRCDNTEKLLLLLDRFCDKYGVYYSECRVVPTDSGA